MVRRDATFGLTPQGEAPSVACCASPAGGSPVPVSVGAPGSRPQPNGRDSGGRGGRRKGLRTEQARGPQRLRALRVKRAGSKLKVGHAERWTRDYFVKGFGLHRLQGTVRYPETA